MQSGMGSNSVTFRLLHEIPEHNLLQDILKLYALIFVDADADYFLDRLRKHNKITAILAYSNDELIGFKIGYPHNEDSFYSWIGGVLPNYRK